MANNAIVSQGSSITITVPGATPFTGLIEDAISFSGPSFTRNEIDVTNLQSTAKEYRLGLKDPGQFSLDVNFNIWDDAGQGAAWEQLNGNVEISVEVRMPGTPERGFDFQALVLNFEVNAQVDDRLTATITLRVTGDVAEVPPSAARVARLAREKTEREAIEKARAEKAAARAVPAKAA